MELISIGNEHLSVVVDADGASLHSVKMEDIEYLWQGDADFWRRRDMNLFPYIGRLTEGKYIYRGKQYPLPTHGFCIGTKFDVSDAGCDHVCFTLTDSDVTREMYPFNFAFHVNYALTGKRITKTYTVQNRGSNTMHFGIGGHPGFNVPLGNDGDFEDWQLRFGVASKPKRVELDPQNFRFAGKYKQFPLKGGNVIPLEHSLFDQDAVILVNADRVVTLESPKSPHSVTVRFPDMPLIGFWHTPGREAPFICIEPWVSLPSHSSYIEDIEKQEYLISLAAGKTYINEITIDLK